MKDSTKCKILVVILSVLTVLAVVLMLDFDFVGWRGAEDPPSKAELAARYGITEAEIDEYHQKYPQKTGLPSVKDDFAPNRLIICVYQFANEYEYTTDDFKEIVCNGVRNLLDPNDEKDRPTRYIIVEINTKSEEQLIEAIELLLQRADVYSVGVDYIISIA